jgi:hypothetical protein
LPWRARKTWSEDRAEVFCGGFFLDFLFFIVLDEIECLVFMSESSVGLTR